MMTYYYKSEEVKALVADNWLAILYGLASDQIGHAIQNVGKHTACPVHGTNKRKGDGFRLFKDSYRTGGGICNTCGPFQDGFKLLMWLKGWDFSQCLLAVGDFVNAPKHLTKKGRAEKARTQATVQPSMKYQPYAKRKEQRTKNQSSKPELRAKGILVDFGAAPYKHDVKNTTSYFVIVQHSTGYKRFFWGVDLERAITAANAKRSDEISLIYHGKKFVTVTQEVVNDQGVVDEREITTHRNEWEVINHTQQANTEFEALDVTTQTPVEENPTPPLSDIEDVSFRYEVMSAPAPVMEKSGIDTVPDWLKKTQSRLAKSEERRKVYSSGLALKHMQLWNECLSITSENSFPVWQYLRGRQINVSKQMLLEGDCFRFHPGLPFYNSDRELEGNFPAIVAAIRDIDGNLITLHRIYLRPSKKSGMPYVAKAKKMMPIPDGFDVNGGAIRLGDPTKSGYLGIAEGIETALSAYRATGIPTWSTVNATLMKSVEIPEGVHTVLIWADLDRSLTGEMAANYLKNVLEDKGIKVGVLLPKYSIPKGQKSLDWNDVLVDQGILGFPSVRYIKQFFEKQALKEFQSSI